MVAIFHSYLRLLGDLGYWLVVAPLRGRSYRLGAAFGQAVKMGVRGVPLTALTAFTIGAVLAMQSAQELQKLGGAHFVPGLVASSLIRELAALVTAVIVIGRSGSAITAELGTMKVSEEIEALQVMAIHPMSFLIVPRVLAMLLMLPVLPIFGFYVGMVGGWLICVQSLAMSTSYFISHALDYVSPGDVGICLLKSVVFALLIVTIACEMGLRVRGGAEGVGTATTASVVTALLAVFVANALITALFFF
jgi:phospholipid/cholesterol/gamma-HCH transport system permease protein